jgi:hypothetical protein
MKDYLNLAIHRLKPNSAFVIYDNDYSTVIWHEIDGDAPTKAEIDAAIKQIKSEEVGEEKAKAAAKAALLDRLGITAEEAALLLG